ncbi:MAG: pyruvate kinase [Bacteroidetes bacterium]|nr:pyruvate kinase [Bacteroidota bacterium]
MSSKTKIIATLGPASSSRKVLKELIIAGVDLCRINFSHGTHDDCAKIIGDIRAINSECGTNVAILADLQGPKIRIGEAKEKTKLKTGSEVLVTDKPGVTTYEVIRINHPGIMKDLKENDTILIDDGNIILHVKEKIKKNYRKAIVVSGGALLSNKGVNLPQSRLSMPSLTQKDRADLEFALEHKIEWIGLSFVRRAEDISELKSRVRERSPHTKIIAKIEKPEAVKNIDAVINASDGIMVARGDLGVEMPMQDVPLIQKMLVKKCLLASRPVIIATQMMESMVNNLFPTRAEVNDVANAIMDGADAVMLSAETSIGKHPVKVIDAVQKIIARTETYEGIYNRHYPPSAPEDPRFISDSVCYNACLLSERIGAKAIITMTHSGYTAFKISAFRPNADIFVFTYNTAILNTMNLLWGVKCFYYDKFASTDQTIDEIKKILKQQGLVKPGDTVINIASIPIAEKGMSNMLKVSRVEAG